MIPSRKPLIQPDGEARELGPDEDVALQPLPHARPKSALSLEEQRAAMLRGKARHLREEAAALDEEAKRLEEKA